MSEYYKALRPLVSNVLTVISENTSLDSRKKPEFKIFDSLCCSPYSTRKDVEIFTILKEVIDEPNV